MTIQYPLPAQFLIGLSDSGKEELMPGSKGQPEIMLTGSAGIHAHLTPGKFRPRKLLLNGRSNDQKLVLGPAPMVNDIADPDSHWWSLAKAGELVEIDGRPCFNAPLQIAQTRRHVMAALLAGIPGLRVPATIRIEPRHPHDFIRAATEARLHFPIIVRLAGAGSGIRDVRVDSVANWEQIHTIPWGGRSVYLTEFVDYVDADGLYRTHRIVMIDGEPVLRHVLIGEQWELRQGSQSNTQEAVQEEIHRLQNFNQETLPHIAGTLAEISRRVGLNYFGLDCHVAEDGTVTLFRIHAGMDVLSNVPQGSRWSQACTAIRMKLETALEKHIARVITQGAAK